MQPALAASALYVASSRAMFLIRPTRRTARNGTLRHRHKVQLLNKTADLKISDNVSSAPKG
jgi:hypothetical protein